MSEPRFRAKYVLVLPPGHPLPVPVLLPENAGVQHKAATAIAPPVSAGFCELFTLGAGAVGFTAGGESVGLHLKARPREDTELLNRFYLGGGFLGPAVATAVPAAVDWRATAARWAALCDRLAMLDSLSLANRALEERAIHQEAAQLPR